MSTTLVSQFIIKSSTEENVDDRTGTRMVALATGTNAGPVIIDMIKDGSFQDYAT